MAEPLKTEEAVAQNESLPQQPTSATIEYTDLEFIKKVGSEGEYGHVWKGKWIPKDMIVAIKKVMDFPEKEVEFLSSLDHPSIIRYYGAVTENISYFILTEFADNGSIFDYIHVEHNQPSPAQGLLWLKQMAKGMLYLHEKDIFHRNLKSSNVVLTSNLDAKIVDLGYAKKKSHTTRERTVIGTYAWMAPEMVRMESVSKKSDVYSYGIIVWEIIAQEVPFSEVMSYALPFKIAEGQHPTIPDKCEPHIADLIESCWKKREARPSFEEILKALETESTVARPPAPPPSTTAETIEYADLEFIECVGKGGFGQVWKGRWKSKKMTVAIKKLTEFPEREINMLSSLDHPSIINYYGTVTEKFQCFIITEFAENGSIFDYIHVKCKKPSLDQEGLPWLKQVAEGMVYLHGRNITHRDLKSSNVVLMSRLDAKIVDLGCARILEHTAMQSTMAGTYAWMAPEMVRREPVSKSCDVYSYGVFVWEIITQQKPFSELKLYELPMKVAAGEHPTIPDNCEPYLTDLMKCCWKEPKARPSFKLILETLDTKDAVALTELISLRPSSPPPSTTEGNRPGGRRGYSPGGEWKMRRWRRDFSPVCERRRRRRDFSPTEDRRSNRDYSPSEERGRRRDFTPAEERRRRSDYSPSECRRRRWDYSPTEEMGRRREFSPAVERRRWSDYSPSECRRRRRDYSPTEEKGRKKDYFPSGGDGGPPSRREFGGSWGREKSLTLQIYSNVGKIIGHGGQKIRDLEEPSGAGIKVHHSQDGEKETAVEITGEPEVREGAMGMMIEELDTPLKNITEMPSYLYTVEVKLNQEQILDQVDVVHSTPLPDPSKCQIISLETIPPILQVNKPITFKVDTRLAGIGQLNIAAMTEVRPELQAAPSKNEPGIVDVVYTPTTAGIHTLKLTWSGENIPGSPLTFDISPIHTHAYGRPVKVDINMDCKIRDLEAYAIHQETDTRCKVKVGKVAKGKFRLILRPKLPGLYDLKVFIKTKEIAGSPFCLRYDTHPRAEAPGPVAPTEVTSPRSPSLSASTSTDMLLLTLSNMTVTSPEFTDLEFIERLGRGKSGHVWKGKWKSMQMAVAIKVMDLPDRESAVLRTLDHPYILQYYGTVTEDVSYFIVTEFAENGSIFDYIHKNHKQPSLAQRLLWLEQVAQGMVYLHERGILHGDLKSSNVVLTSVLDSKIDGLGSTHLLEHSVEQKELVATNAWMAPEVVRRESISNSSDVYSYGILTWEIITQKMPFSDVALFELSYRIANGEHPDNGELYLADLMESCWKTPKARPSFKQILELLAAELEQREPPSPEKSLTTEDTLEFSDLDFIERVGRGGSGHVWKGYWKSMNMTVAVKKVIDRPETEIKILRSLNHPAIVQYYGMVTMTHSYFIVTEFAENGSIFDYLHVEHKHPSVVQRLLWLKQMAEGMVYLHGLNIIHRDLKSSNILLMSTLDAKIADLGSARTLEEAKQRKEVVGTYAWMAPEIFRRESVSKSSDVYSYGIVLWETVTQQVPFSDVKYYEMINKIAAGEHPTIPDDCEPHLADLMKFCWQEPKNRPTFENILEILNIMGSRLVEIEYSDLEFIENAGIGGFGAVSKGRWISENKIVAIKMLTVLDEREVRILGSLDHPSIIQYYGTATQDDVHYIVTEFAEGGSIYDYIHRKNEQLRLPKALHWAVQVAEGMVYLHRRDIIHGNLKSSNVVLTSTLDAKICDFGSPQTWRHSTRLTTAGTYAWMAPEMLRREAVFKSSDIYSYGVLLFELVTQLVPFSDIVPIMLPAVIIEGKRPNIPETCDSHLADLIKCCWQEDTEARPNFEDILVILKTG